MSRRVSRGWVPAALSAARKAAGWSVGQLAIASGVGVTSLARWESGQGAPSIDKLRRVVQALRPDQPLQLASELFNIPVDDRYPSDWRALRLLTLDDLAELAQVNVQMLGRIERGQVWPSEPRIIERIAKELDVQSDELRAAFLRARRDAL